MKGKRSLGPLLGVTHFSCATTYLVSQPVLYIIFINKNKEDKSSKNGGFCNDFFSSFLLGVKIRSLSSFQGHCLLFKATCSSL